MKTVRTFFSVLLLGLLSLPPTSGAEQILAVGAEFANIFEQTREGEYTGFAMEILRLLAKRNGDQVSFGIYPWSRAQWMVEHGQAQILIGPYKNPEREERFTFARRPFYRDFMVFYARQNDSRRWTGSYADLHDAKIGVIHGWAYGAQFEVSKNSLKPEMVNSLLNGLNMLEAKHIDLLATNLRNTDAIIRKSNGRYSGLLPLEPVIDIQDGYLAYCPHHCKKLQLRYDELFEQLLAEEDFQRLAYKYGIRVPRDR